MLGVLQALMSLFVLASKDGWVNIMYHGLDAVGIDQQVRTTPLQNLNNTQYEWACGKSCTVCSPSPWFCASWFGSRSQWQILSSPHASISSFSSFFFWGSPRLLRPDGTLNLSCCSPRFSTQLDPFHNSPTGRNPDQITTPPQSAQTVEYTLFTLIHRVVAKHKRI